MKLSLIIFYILFLLENHTFTKIYFLLDRHSEAWSTILMLNVCHTHINGSMKSWSTTHMVVYYIQLTCRRHVTAPLATFADDTTRIASHENAVIASRRPQHHLDKIENSMKSIYATLTLKRDSCWTIAHYHLPPKELTFRME